MRLSRTIRDQCRENSQAACAIKAPNAITSRGFHTESQRMKADFETGSLLSVTGKPLRQINTPMTSITRPTCPAYIRATLGAYPRQSVVFGRRRKPNARPDASNCSVAIFFE
jgi:hypothetical protein